MCKICNNVDDVEYNDLFCYVQEGVTRNFTGKVVLKHCKTNKRKLSFTFRVIAPLNSLPCTTKFAICANSFKNLLDGDPKFHTKLYEYDG